MSPQHRHFTFFKIKHGTTEGLFILDYEQRLGPTVFRLKQASGIMVLLLDLALLQWLPRTVRGLIGAVTTPLTTLKLIAAPCPGHINNAWLCFDWLWCLQHHRALVIWTDQQHKSINHSKFPLTGAKNIYKIILKNHTSPGCATIQIFSN